MDGFNEGEVLGGVVESVWSGFECEVEWSVWFKCSGVFKCYLKEWSVCVWLIW